MSVRVDLVVSWDAADDELLDLRQAVALLTVKPSTLLAWAHDGRVPVVRLGPVTFAGPGRC